MNSHFARALILGLGLTALPSSPVLAQSSKSPTNSPPPRPAVRPAPLISPEKLSDGSVTFRFRAPKAAEVKVSGQFGPDATLTKDDQGIWSTTVPKVPSGVHEYRFVVDGVSTIDSQNPAVKPQRWPTTSILHVPAQPPELWDLRDIPHGTLHEHTYFSKALRTWRRVIVYTPPNYKSSRSLPVLYLAHGFSDNEGTWTVHGKAHWILDALIAEKKATPMLIVMPDAHALPPAGGNWDDYATANTAGFAKELTEDVVPLVEANYKVSAQRRSRAFAGLSMGGHHALTIALNHHETFGYIGAFSSAPPQETNVASGLASPKSVNQDLKLFWIGCGKKDFLFQRNNDFTSMLKQKGIAHEYAVTEGDHSWPIWRNYLATFAPKLFK